jgi:predicted secreted hydrolase
MATWSRTSLFLATIAKRDRKKAKQMKQQEKEERCARGKAEKPTAPFHLKW